MTQYFSIKKFDNSNMIYAEYISDIDTFTGEYAYILRISNWVPYFYSSLREALDIPF